MQPITYYIDRTVPVEWRPYVRAGILEWNRAFEDAGFRDAIKVLDAPDDSAWSAEDARYSTVRWTATNRAVYAIGPTNVDPRTGEILNADVLISAGWIQRWRGQSAQFTSPVASVQSVLPEDSAGLGATRTLQLRRGPRARRRSGHRPPFVPWGHRAGRNARQGVHRAGDQGARHARDRAHAGTAPQLPRLRGGNLRPARQSGMDQHAWLRRVGHGLHAGGAGGRSRPAGRLLLAHHRLV